MDIQIPSNLNVIQTAPGWKLFELPKIKDSRGNLTFVESQNHIPFEIKRTYYLYDVPGGESRGAHGHKHLEQLMIAISGSFEVVLSDGINQERFHLNKPFMGLYIPPKTWRVLENFSSGSVCLVLASLPYSEDDYLRNYNDFLKYIAL